MILLLSFIHAASAQSELERVEQETKDIHDSVQASRAQLDALRAKLAEGGGVELTLLPMTVAEGYEVDDVRYFVDGLPVARGQAESLVEVPSRGTLTARAVVRGGKLLALQSTGYRMQGSTEISSLDVKKGATRAVLAEQDGRPVLVFEQ